MSSARRRLRTPSTRAFNSQGECHSECSGPRCTPRSTFPAETAPLFLLPNELLSGCCASRITKSRSHGPQPIATPFHHRDSRPNIRVTSCAAPVTLQRQTTSSHVHTPSISGQSTYHNVPTLTIDCSAIARLLTVALFNIHLLAFTCKTHYRQPTVTKHSSLLTLIARICRANDRQDGLRAEFRVQGGQAAK